jgi:hypothetical protein
MSGKEGLFDEERHRVFVLIAKGFQDYAQNDVIWFKSWTS